MCEYCEKGKGICRNNRKELGIELHSGSRKLIAYGFDEQNWDMSIECKINFCPMCRKRVERS